MEPLAVAIHALSTIAQLKSTQNVAVFGAGLLNPSRKLWSFVLTFLAHSRSRGLVMHGHSESTGREVDPRNRSVS
jgi:hypothetical protein